MRTPTHIARRIAAVGLLAGAMMMCACASAPWEGFPPAGASELVYPPAPLPPRVEYVQSIRSHEDLYQTPTGFAGIKTFLAGAKDSQIARPYAIAMHPDGGLLVTDPARQGVHYFEWAKSDYRFIGDDLEGGLPSPVGVAALPNGDILVSDSRLEAIERFAPDGEWKGVFADGFGRPAGLAIDAQRGRVYVVDVTNHQVDVLDLQGNTLQTWGERGGAPEQFNYPTHIAVAPNGNVAVTDSMNFRVQLFTPGGDYLESFGEIGNSQGQFSKPKGVAVDGSGNVIVVEGLYDALQFFSPNGDLLLSIGGPGPEPGEFWLPAGLAFDASDGLLFVADSYNNRVQVFRLLETGSPAFSGEEATQQ
ncbi:hypothetical protein KQI84_02590 [bacterium]|nr:hypothetical protein [bacterium]